MKARVYPMPSLRTVAMRAVHVRCKSYWAKAMLGWLVSWALAMVCAYFDLMPAAWALVALSAACVGAATVALILGKEYAP